MLTAKGGKTMGVSIDLSGLKVRGNARVMNDVKITGYEDAKIRAENTEIDGNVEFWSGWR